MSDKIPYGNPNWGKYKENKAAVIAILGGKCAICGTTERLEIDHIKREDKGFELSMFFTVASPTELMEEIKKCQLLCHEHHMEKTIRERGQTSAKGTHGTLSSYRYCKCEICVAAHAKYCAEWKLKKKAEKEARRKKNV